MNAPYLQRRIGDGLSGDIAIVGMACLFPGADNPQRYFANICRKLEFIRDPMPEWEQDRYLGGIGANRIPTVRGGYLGEAYSADIVDLGVMPASVDGSEPDHFLALRIAQEALRDATRDGHEIDRARTGVILGHSTYLHRGHGVLIQHGIVLDQTREILGQLLPGVPPETLDRVRAALADQLPKFTSDISPGLVPNVMTGRIANRLDLNGPNFLVDAACSAAHLAIQAAMQELRAGRSDLMLAGGVNATIPAEVYMLFNQLGALAQSGHVRPFAEGGDGTLMGEGLGILALKRAEDAFAEGDRVYAVLKGIGQSSDGKGSGILAPRLEGEMLAIQRALVDAGQDPEAPDIPGLIECHGTGIPLGDRTEISAITNVFGKRAEGAVPPIAIGSVKSMIGHTIPAAGAAGIIKAALSLHHRTLPPTLAEGGIRAGLPIHESRAYLNTETRPWIAPEGHLRRAGVNAFGFGGINAHAVLEQAPLPDGEAGAPPRHWPHELVLLSAENAPALAARCRDLIAAVERHAAAPLCDIAARIVADAGSGPNRLALTAESHDDLAEKLAKAAERLEGGKSAFRLRSGVVATDGATPGKLAFVFPGEGAQYQGMLGEILTHFPVARGWFDFWDGLFPDRAIPPSVSVFPPTTTLEDDLSRALAGRLFGLELGSEAMFISAQALMAVLRQLGIAPDVVVGHSSGEHSALAAAGVFGDGADRTDFAGRIRALNALYEKIEASGGIEGGALLTVGGVDRTRILEMVEADPGLHLALDNCHHQAVLYGSRAKMEEVVEALRPEGGMCSFLPFDRPYHTPLFADVAEQVARVYKDMAFNAPQVPIWSCATVQPMPADPVEIRALVAYQWASRVRFHETVEALHDDGVTTFLEVGPSANLTGFIDDALKGRDAVALPLDSRRRGGLQHFLASLGRLWALGHDVDASALFAGRGVGECDLAADPPKSRLRRINNTLDYLRLPEEVAAGIRDEIAASLGQGAQPVPEAVQNSRILEAPQISGNLGTPPAEPAGDMGGFFGVMQQFLDMQGNVMEAALGVSPGTASATGDWQPPMFHRILEQDDGRLLAESDFDPLTDPFIAHHTLYADDVSDTDPDLQSLPVLPLACSMEMVVEAAAVLTGQMTTRLENVRARDWVAFDDGPGTIVTEARVIPDDGASGEIRVSVRLTRPDGSPLFEADAVIGEGAELAPLPPLAAPRAPIWAEHELYTTGMFHGPLFQGVARLIAWDETGIDAELADLPLGEFFGHGEDPSGLLLNPALLDQMGHVTAFWIAQGSGTDFSAFPSSIDRIDLGPGIREEALSGATISCRVGLRDPEDRPVGSVAEARFMQADLEAHLPDGTLLMRASTWRDRFFRVPHAFYQARFRPREAFLGHAADLFDAGPDVTIWRVPAFPHGFLEDAGGLWTRLLVNTMLSAPERAQWAAMTGPARRRRDWLMGRIALKEAARAWIAAQHGVLCLPADMVIIVAEGGKPHLDPGPLAALGIGRAPEISLAHAAGGAIAVAAPPGRPAGIDMEPVEGVDAALLAEGGFSETEIALLGEAPDPARLLAGWCAKEAAAKMGGEGLNGRPKTFVLERIGADSATIQRPDGRRIDVALARDGATVMALSVEA
ncbi:acyltransferase domain-containing protein [Ponticoccus sp. SC2-23]|uniref:type I polyketide synthase n=1 Tax=Alexandriicola marinus TaxID=2081710 RepID=UPI000FDB8954|nr:type I polyketide synthase [Alexandriicola marinus]MBM1222498.1 acyltransferase domain-containing protein [Ponticoccus sp. SC6-9]MBM1227004.1 acyltransferase domain-containing protein [Ponticoccus sp. SC6-15]MBM1231425.1 acyltransferase domain-containing protein [Ponticoccus sp. SC6-38]MBM1235998.1 acyltransferase domain-containing protein [Ponticoccus sp. SC6-45]MBM1240448.1 acyltransferase domain-containing protein [Ponticoccus sp. SC6-49]MBM1244983.1 acyltransferase domain-containing pr